MKNILLATHVGFLYAGGDRAGLVACLETALSGHRPCCEYPETDAVHHVEGYVRSWKRRTRINLCRTTRFDDSMTFFVDHVWKAEFDAQIPHHAIAQNAADSFWESLMLLVGNHHIGGFNAPRDPI